MLATGVAYAVMLLTLAGVAVYAIMASRTMKVTNLNNFFSAKNSQTTLNLSWCFFASIMGSSTLFSFPEVGAKAGTWGVIGAVLSGVLGFIILAIVGPYSRSVLGEGISLTDFMFTRYGRTMQVYVAFVAIWYQFITFVSELTCVGDLTVYVSPDAHRSITIVAVVVFTNLYLLIGGLRASLATDVMQGIGAISIVCLVFIAIIVGVDVPKGSWSTSHVADFTTDGFGALIILSIGVASSNLFLTGYWQRVYSAKDDATLRRACIWASVFVTIFSVVLCVSGMFSALAYPDGVYLFAIITHMHWIWQVLIAVVIASLASSVADSIQLGIAAELASIFPKINIAHARVICVLLCVPACMIALKGYNVVHLYLVSDVLCVITIGPMLLGVWSRINSTGAIAGCIVGLLTVFLYGWIRLGSFFDGFKWFILPDGLYSFHSMCTCVLGMILPILATIGVSIAFPTTRTSSVSKPLEITEDKPLDAAYIAA